MFLGGSSAGFSANSKAFIFFAPGKLFALLQVQRSIPHFRHISNLARRFFRIEVFP
jgi:hypothetical protein